MPLERLQKILARAGVASRRSAEELILGGRVRVNGKVARELGTRADPRRDKIEVDNRRIQAEDLVYLVLHKPRGYVSTVDDPEGRPTVLDLVKGVPARLYPVGRLDFATSGVLLLTNDGAMTQGLLHPRSAVPKIYVVKLDGLIEEAELVRWREGMAIEGDDGATLRTRPAEVHRIRDEDGKSWLRVILAEGKNQQIRRMAAASGFVVMRLARISFAGIDHDDLRPGEWRPLSVDELRKLKKTYGVPTRVRAQQALNEIWAKSRDKDPRDKGRTKRKPRPRGRTATASAPGGESPGAERGAKRRSSEERPSRARGPQKPARSKRSPRANEGGAVEARGPSGPSRGAGRRGGEGTKRPPRG